MISIHGLNKEQIRMCDRMWSMNTMSELTKWISRLPTEKELMARTLHEMMRQELLEEKLQKTEHYPIAEDLLKKIAKHR